MNRDELQAQCMRVPYFRFIGFEIDEVGEEYVVARLDQAGRHIGNSVIGAFHGGMLASFMEAVASAAVSRNCNIRRPKPVNMTVDFLRPALAGTLFVRAEIVRKGRRIASIEAIASQKDAAKPVARGLFHFLLI
jgi:uncharacterized protein (TIGR00369 family)